MNELTPENFDLLLLSATVPPETASLEVLFPEVPVGRLEQTPPKRKYHQRPIVACAECLFKLGYGYNRIARLIFGVAKGQEQRRKRQKIATWAQWHEWKRDFDPLTTWRNTLPPRTPKPPKKAKDLKQYTANSKAKKYLRRMVWSFFRHGLYPKVCAKLLGCSRKQFIEYIQRKFKPGMTMENYGSYWVLDHIHPCKYFDLTIPLQRHICFHYSNYQPLRTETNRRKGASKPNRQTQVEMLL